MRAIPWLPAVAALLLGLPAAAQEDRQFQPTGELQFNVSGSAGSSAAFDDARIVGPDVNLARREDGSWGGDLLGQSLDLEVKGTRVTAPNVTLEVTQKNGRTAVEGLFFGRRIRVELNAKKLEGRNGVCSFDMPRRRPGWVQGNIGCLPSGSRFPTATSATLKLDGAAADPQPPALPLALALVAILPG